MCMKTIVIIWLFLLLGCMTPKWKYSETELDKLRNKTEFTTDFISKEKFVTLLNHNNIDSLYNYLKTNSCFHSSTYSIINTPDPGHSIPSFEFDFAETQRVTIILLDTLYNFVEVLINAEFEMGPYTIYANWEQGQEKSIETYPFFKLLKIFGDEYTREKGLILK